MPKALRRRCAAWSRPGPPPRRCPALRVRALYSGAVRSRSDRKLLRLMQALSGDFGTFFAARLNSGVRLAVPPAAQRPRAGPEQRPCYALA